MKLTDAQVKAIQATNKPQKISDGDGLMLLVTVVGSKLWQFRYDRPNRAKRTQNELALGKYPTVSLKQARELKDDAKLLLAQGIDPAVQRRQDKHNKILETQNTVKSIATKWYNIQKSHYRTTDHSKRIWERLEKNVFSQIGNEAVADVTTPMAISLINQVVNRGALDVAKRTLSLCKAIFRYAVLHEYCDNNPFINIEAKHLIPSKPVENQKRVAVSAFPKLLQDIDGFQGNRLHKLALQLITLVFVRHDELRLAEWTEFDLDKKIWSIPESRMKMKLPHIVPLSTQAIALLDQIRIINGHKKYLFASNQSKAGVMSEAAMLKVLHKLGYKDQQTVHGLRGLASTILNEQGYNPDHIEAQLAHKDPNGIRAAYNHAQYLPERAKMMQAWSDYVYKQMA